MKNYVQEGHVLPYVVPASTTITAGQGVKVGLFFGVAVNGGTTGATLSLSLDGVFTLPKATGAISQGAAVYWDDTNKRCTTTASGNLPIGLAWAAAGSSDASVVVRLSRVATIAA